MIAKHKQRITITLTNKAIARIQEIRGKNNLTNSEVIEGMLLNGSVEYGSKDFILRMLISRVKPYINANITKFGARYIIVDDSFKFIAITVDDRKITGTIYIDRIEVDNEKNI